MSHPETNKAVAHRYMKALIDGDIATIEGLQHPDVPMPIIIAAPPQSIIMFSSYVRGWKFPLAGYVICGLAADATSGCF